MRSKRIKPPEGGKGGQAGEIKMVCSHNHRLPCMAPDPDRVMDMDISTHTSLAGRDRYILYKIPAVHPTSRDGQIQCI